MDVVKTHTGNTALSFSATITPDVLAKLDDLGRVDVVVYYHAAYGEYFIVPKENRVKEVVRSINLTSVAVELNDEEKNLLRDEYGLVPAVRALIKRNPGLSLKDAKCLCDIFREKKMYWDASLKEFNFLEKD